MLTENQWLLLGLALALFLLLVDAANRLFNLRHYLRRNIVFLEVTPPAFSDKTPLATSHLFATLHRMGGRTRLERLLNRKHPYSLEVVSTRKEGIRYLIGLPHQDVPILQQSIASYLPGARFRVVDDYLPASFDHLSLGVIELQQSSHFAFPTNAHSSLTQHDPIDYIAGAMTKLEPGELLAMQLVVSPDYVRKAGRIRDKIMDNKKIWSSTAPPRRRLLVLAYFIVFSPILILYGIAYVLSAGRIAESNKEELSPAERDLHALVYEKVKQPLFFTKARVLIAASYPERTNQRWRGFLASLASFSNGHQGIYSKSSFPFHSLIRKLRLWAFRHRLPGFVPMLSNVLATSELADIYHFPFGDAQTEDMVKSHSRTLPAPLLLKNHADSANFDIVLGLNHHHGTSTNIGLTRADRERHAYIIGGTGNGKTTMMLGGMIQDAHKWKGFAFIDPHGDAAETLISHVPEERAKDVIYFNPDDLGHPIGLNLLELREGLTDDELLREKDLVTEATISVFRKIFSDEDEGGHRIEYVLRNAVQTALTQPGATLFTVFDLLNDPKYRKQVVTQLQDKDLKNFWQQEIGKAGDFQRVKMAAGITAKIGRFLFSASAKRILEQPKSTIDFDDIMNSGKVLVCNFSKGLLGEDTSELFGITVLAKLQMAALRRARIKQADRRPFYLYVDEFQNFATTSFVQMLSEARKYQLFMTLAEQSTSQQKDQRMVQVILANVGTLVCFRTGNPADEKLILPFFAPYIDAGEIANLPAYNFYMRIAGVQTQEPFSGETILPPEEGSERIAHQVVEHTRDHYARKTAPTTDRPVPKPKADTEEKDQDRKPESRRPQKKHKVTK